MDYILNLIAPKEVTHEDLGKLGGDPHFRPPAPDRAQQILQGQRLTAKHSALYRWWYWE
jgi:hypothetical protein